MEHGANTSNESGNNVYELGDLDVAGTHYSSIWDTGGIDTLAYNGSRDAVLDLRPATLQYENGGGGFASSTNDVHGGFTIANGVE